MEDRVIPRQMINIRLTLSNSQSVSGDLQIDLDSRLSDFMNRPEQFIVIRDSDGGVRIINKAHIVDVRTSDIERS